MNGRSTLPFAPARLPFRGHLLALVLPLLWVGPPMSHAAEPSLASVERLSFSVAYTTLDGTELPMVVLRSRSVSLVTDSVRQWQPLEEPVGSAAFSFRDEKDASTTLSIYVLAPDWANDSDAVWKRYLRAVQDRLGDGTSISGRLDSAEGPPAMKLFGWHTREVVFTAPGNVPAEHHVMATNGRQALLFMLRGPAGTLARFDDPFHQLIVHMTLQ